MNNSVTGQNILKSDIIATQRKFKQENEQLNVYLKLPPPTPAEGPWYNWLTEQLDHDL